MQASPIRIEHRRDAAVVVITIDRQARRNAVDMAARLALRDAFAAVNADRSTRLVVLTGAGGHFCAGDDIKAFPDPSNARAVADWRAAIQSSYAAMQALRVPVVAAISGACVGGGLSLAMSCDFRVADASARFGIPAARLSVTYPTAQLQRLVGLVGIATARRWLYSADTVDADAALSAGLIDRLVSAHPEATAANELVEHAIDFMSPVLDNSPLAVACLKLQLDAIADDTVGGHEEAVDRSMRAVETSADSREAIEAFRAKRRPRFIGR